MNAFKVLYCQNNCLFLLRELIVCYHMKSHECIDYFNFINASNIQDNFNVYQENIRSFQQVASWIFVKKIKKKKTIFEI